MYTKLQQPGSPRGSRWGTKIDSKAVKWLLLGAFLGVLGSMLARQASDTHNRSVLCASIGTAPAIAAGADATAANTVGTISDVSAQCSAAAASAAAKASGWQSGIAFELEHHSGWIQRDPKKLPSGEWFQEEHRAKLSGKTVSPYDAWVCDLLAQYKV